VISVEPDSSNAMAAAVVKSFAVDAGRKSLSSSRP